MRPRARASFSLAAGVGTYLFAWEVAASGLDVPMIGNGLSGGATADAAAVHWNPAMLGFQERGEASINLGVVAGRIDYQRNRRGTYQIEDGLQFVEPIDPAYIDPEKSGVAPSVMSPILSGAGDIFVSAPVVRDRFVLGGGIYAPYAAIVDFPAGGAQRWQMQQASIVVLHTTLAAALRVHDKVSLGAGLSYVFATGSISRVQDFGAVQLFADGVASEPVGLENDFGEDAPTTVRELDVLARPFSFTRGISHGVSFNAGIAVRPRPPLTLAVSYDHGSRLQLRGRFTMDMNEDFFTQDLASQGLAFPPLVEGEAQLAFRLPRRATLSVAAQVSEKLGLDLDVGVVFWQVLESFDIVLDSEDLVQEELGIPARNEVSIPRDWRNAAHVELGSRIGLGERVLLFLSLGYHSPASPDATIDVASPDGHRLLGGAGVRVGVSERVGLLIDGELQGILPREVVDSAHDLGNGTYRLLLGTVAAHVQVAFGRGGRAPERGAARGSPP